MKTVRLIQPGAARLWLIFLAVTALAAFAPAAGAQNGPTERLVGRWQGEITEHGTALPLTLELSVSGHLDLVVATCTVSKDVDTVTDTSLIYVFSREGVRFCANDPVLTLTAGGPGELILHLEDPANNLAELTATLTRPGTAPAAPPAQVAAGGWRDLVDEGSRFVGRVRSEPRTLGGPRRTYVVDVDFVGDAPVVRLLQHESDTDPACLGALQFVRLVPPVSAQFTFGRLSGRGDIIMDCPDGVAVTVSLNAEGLFYEWTPREGEEVSGVLSDVAARIAAEQAAATAAATAAAAAAEAAARNADPCTHAVWDGVQVNIVDAFLCDEGRAIALMRAGAPVDLVVTEVAFTAGRLMAISAAAALSGQGNLTITCVFPEDDDTRFSSGDTIAVDARLDDYGQGRLTLACTARD